MTGTIITVILVALIAIWFFINLKKMINNVKEGKSIDGCNGDCGHCSGGCHK